MSDHDITVAALPNGDILLTRKGASGPETFVMDRKAATATAMKLFTLPPVLTHIAPFLVADVSIDAPETVDDYATLHLEIAGRSIPILVDLNKLVAETELALAQCDEALFDPSSRG